MANAFDQFDAPAAVSSYDTKLSSVDEGKFSAWKQQYAPNDSGGDYDLRGAYKEGLKPDPVTGHWPDTYKKPNHPTFSDQSIYAKDAPEKAGHWDGDTYVPPSANPFDSFDTPPIDGNSMFGVHLNALPNTPPPTTPIDKWKNAYSGLVGLDQRLPPDQRAAFKMLADNTDNSSEVRAKAINRAFIKDHLPGWSDSQIDDNFQAVTDGFAKKVYGIDHANVAQTELYGMIHSHFNAEDSLKLEWEMAKDPTKKLDALRNYFLAPGSAWNFYKKSVEQSMTGGPNVPSLKNLSLEEEENFEFPKAADAGASLVNAAAGTANSILTPGGVSMAANPAALAYAAPYFAASTWEAAKKTFGDFTDAWQGRPSADGTPVSSGTLSRDVIDTAFGFLATTGGVLHGAKGTGSMFESVVDHAKLAETLRAEAVKTPLPQIKEAFNNAADHFEKVAETAEAVKENAKTEGGTEKPKNPAPVEFDSHETDEGFPEQWHATEDIPPFEGKPEGITKNGNVSPADLRLLEKAGYDVPETPPKPEAEVHDLENGSFVVTDKNTGNPIDYATTEAEAQRIADSHNAAINKPVEEPLQEPEVKPDVVDEVLGIEPKAPTGDGATTGIAHRVSEASGKAAPRGEGISASDSVEHGRDLLKDGYDLAKGFEDFNKTKAVSADLVAAARARVEELAKKANAAADEHGTNSEQYRKASDAERKMIEMVKPIQTEWHRAGQAQQGETEIDTGTFHGLARAFKDSTGKDFTPEQADKAHEVAKEVKDATEKEIKAKDKLLKAALGDEVVRPRSKRVLDYLSSNADAARERIKQRLENALGAHAVEGEDVGGLLSKDNLEDIATVGADYIAKGAAEIGEWSVKMVKEFGESLKPHLDGLWERSKEALDESKVDTQLAAKKARLEAAIKELSKKIAEEDTSTKGEKSSRPSIQEIETLEQQRDGLREQLTSMRDVERKAEDLTEAIAEKTRKISEGDLSTEGMPVNRPAPEAIEKLKQERDALNKDLAEARKADPVKRRVSEIQEKIDALKAKIDSGDLSREKSAGNNDRPQVEEIEKAKQRLDDLREKLADARKDESDSQSLQKKLDALNERIASKREQLRTGNFDSEPKSSVKLSRPQAEQLEKARQELDSLNKQISDASKSTESEKSAARLDAQIKELERQIASGEVFPEGKKPAVDDPALKARKERLAQLKYERDNIRETLQPSADPATPKPTPAEIIATHTDGEKWTPEQARALWEKAKEDYFDKGKTDFDDIRNGLAIDLGLPVKDITEGLATPKGLRAITDEMYARAAEKRRVVNQAKTFLTEAKNPGWLNNMKSVPGFFFNLATLGHGTVSGITHMGVEMFDLPAAKDYWTAFGQQFKLLGWHDRGAYHERMMQDLVRDPLFIKAKRAGLANDPFKYQDDYQNSLAVKFFKKIGLSGNRGFDALKLFRQNRFNARWEALPESLKTPEMAKEIAALGNHETGVVTNVHKFSIGNAPSWLLFAPKLEASRWAYLIGDPARAAKIFANWKNETPEARQFFKMQVKQKAYIAGTYIGALAINQGLLSASGSDEEINFTDPRHGDWLSFKGGGHKVGVISPMVGSVRFLVNLARDSQADQSKFQEATGSRSDQMAKDTKEYLRGKLSPFAKIVVDSITQKDFKGNTMPWSKDKIAEHDRKQGEHKMGTVEYALKNLPPIPAQEFFTETWKKQGMNDAQIKDLVQAMIVAGFMGTTGARVTEDTSKKKK